MHSNIIDDDHNINSRRNPKRKLRGVNKWYMGEDVAILSTEAYIKRVNEFHVFFFHMSLDHRVVSSYHQLDAMILQ